MAAKGNNGGGARWFYVALAGLVVAGAAWLFTAGGPEGDAEAPAPLSLAETTAIEADPAAGTAIGPEDAPVVIYDFSDYLCPHCRDFNAMVGKLLRREFAGPGGPLRWVSYEFPLQEASIPATLAAHCAGEQGRYWDMHDMLFARVDAWARESNPTGTFVDLAEEMGMDGRALRSCIRERRGLRQILGAKQYGVELGVTGTPTIFVNGEAVPRTNQYYSYPGLAALLRDAASGPAAAEAGGAGS
ncbi:MAG: thioredoxin domain-containing protein [Gemmatimonadota bacterium]|nr:thioredoxin domain-containing protein [Gemmatimonadota bacterium]